MHHLQICKFILSVPVTVSAMIYSDSPAPVTLPIHTYCLPDSVAWIESMVNVLEYRETLSLCTRSLDRIASSFIGPNVMFTIKGMSTVSSNCTVQVKLGDDPANIV